MKVLLTGANGFIGRHLDQMLSMRGHRVIRAMRPQHCTTSFSDVFEISEIDIGTHWAPTLDGVDVVIHTAARVHVLYETVADPEKEFRNVNYHGTLHLAQEAAKAGVKRFVFISTIGVLGNYSVSPLNESNQPNPSNAYSTSKWEAEKALMKLAETGAIEVVIIRPPLVYGPGVKANFYRLMHCVAQGKPLPFGRVMNQRDFVSATNLSDFIVQCMDHPKAANQTFLVADGEPISTPRLIRLLGELLDKPARLLPVPVRILSLGARLLRKERLYHSVCSSLRIDTAKARELLGWVPPQSVADALEETVAWYRAALAGETPCPKTERIAA